MKFCVDLTTAKLDQAQMAVFSGALFGLCTSYGVSIQRDYSPSDQTPKYKKPKIKKTWKRWTTEDTQVVIYLYNQGQPTLRIAKNVNRKPSAISSRLTILASQGLVTLRHPRTVIQPSSRPLLGTGT